MAIKVQEMVALIRSNRMRRQLMAFALAAAIALGMLLGPAATALADGNIRLTVKPGLDGIVRHGAWVPVTVTASNSGTDFSGTVVLRLFEEYSIQATEWRRDFTVAAGEEAEAVFYVPAGQTVAQAELLGPGGTVVASAESRMQFRDGVIAGVVAGNQDTLRLLAGVDLRPGQTQGGPPSAISVVRLSPHDLPGFSRALGSLDILAFNDISSQELTAEQWGAIEAWVGQGGVLILGGGPGWRQTFAAVPAALQPVEISGTTTLSGLPALAAFAGEELPEQPVVVSDGRLRHGRIVVEEAGVPLIVESRYGDGHVFYTAFDLGLDPIAFWRGNSPMWRQLLSSVVPINPYYGPGRTVDMQWVVRQFPHLNFPSTRTLLFVLLGYVIVIGPVNYFVLKRLDRRDWMWVTVPTLVAVFGAIIYGFGFSGNRDVLTNSVGVLHLVPGAERVPADTYVGFYAPTRSRISFAFNPRQHVAPMLTYNRWGSTASTEREVLATVQHGAATSIQYGEANNWTVRGFTVMQDVPVSGRIEGKLVPTASGDIGGTVVNNTPFDLEDVHVIIMNTFVSIGDLPAGAAREVAVPPAQQQSHYREDIAWKIYGPQPPHYDSSPQRQQRREVLQNAFNQYADNRPHPVTVFGWTRQPLTELEFGGNAEQHASLSLVYGAMEFALPSDDFVLPAGLLTAEVYDHDMTHGWFGNGLVNMESGWVAFSLQLPALPAGVELAELKLAVDRMGAAANVLVHELYNWQTGAWDEVTVSRNEIAVTDLDAYLYDGEVRLRVSMQQSGYVEVPFPSAVVTGKKVGQ